MFNLRNAVIKQEMFEYTKINGLPVIPKIKDKPVSHIDSTVYDTKAELESKAIHKSFKSKTMDFGKRLKNKKQHRPCQNIGAFMKTFIGDIK